MSELRRDEMAAALSARRELGPEYDEAVTERLAEKMHEEIARQVEARLAEERKAAPQRLTNNQRVAVTIVSLGIAFMSTGGVVAGDAAWLAVVIWLAAAAIGVAVNLDRRR